MRMQDVIIADLAPRLFYSHARSDMRVYQSTFSRPSDLGRAGI